MWTALSALLIGILKLFLNLKPASQQDADDTKALARRLRDLARRKLRD